MGRKRKHEANETEYDPPSSHLVVSHIKKQEKRLIIILEKAQLESVKVCYILFVNFYYCIMF